MNLPLEFFLTSLTKSSKNLVFQEERYPFLAKCRNFESLLLEEKGDRSGVPRNELVSFGGSRVSGG